ncbi:hypothetical protein G9A89_020338 [Geosiphon pyriformis]|nr:hypothetical protein G9A89_020338 [Geosiphon pyriformis]
MSLVKHLFIVKKRYQKSKYYEFKAFEDTVIRKTIDHHIENFCSKKKQIIKSILDYLFYKVVLNHLVVGNELVVESEIRVEHSIEDSLPERIPAIKLRKKLTKLQFREAMDKTIIIESLSIIQRTQPNPSNTKLSDTKPSDYQ